MTSSVSAILADLAALGFHVTVAAHGRLRVRAAAAPDAKAWDLLEALRDLPRDQVLEALVPLAPRPETERARCPDCDQAFIRPAGVAIHEAAPCPACEPEKYAAALEQATDPMAPSIPTPAWERASRGFAAQGIEPDPGSVAVAAWLEHELARPDSSVDPKRAPVTLAELYRGGLRGAFERDRMGQLRPSLRAPRAARCASTVTITRRFTRCQGCGEPVREHPSGICFLCWAGLELGDEHPKLVRAAVELIQQLGPAGARGARLEQAQALARARGWKPEKSQQRGAGAVGAVTEEQAACFN